jgi:DNA (cytosine-5)-methyltransferase 1
MTVPRKLEKVDIYVCGFPCQPFSTIGHRLGSSDTRSNIFFHCLKAIKITKPTIFILENVKGLLTANKGQYFKSVIKELSGLKEYRMHYFLLNTKDYGIPQNRERLFIVGIKSSKIVKDLQIPRKIKCRDIRSYIDRKYTIREKYCDTYLTKLDQFKDATFANLGTLFEENKNYRVDPNYSPTLTASVPLWCIPMHRKATIKECLALQGFPKNFKQVVSDSQMRRQIGNSISVNVLECLFTECFRAIGL